MSWPFFRRCYTSWRCLGMMMRLQHVGGHKPHYKSLSMLVELKKVFPSGMSFAVLADAGVGFDSFAESSRNQLQSTLAMREFPENISSLKPCRSIRLCSFQSTLARVKTLSPHAKQNHCTTITSSYPMTNRVWSPCDAEIHQTRSLLISYFQLARNYLLLVIYELAHEKEFADISN